MTEPKAHASDLDAGRDEALLRGLSARLTRQSGSLQENSKSEAMCFLMREEAAAIDRLLAALSSKSQAAEGMAKALEQVMSWISNWDPNFIYDPAWPADADEARTALSHYRTLGGQ